MKDLRARRALPALALAALAMGGLLAASGCSSGAQANRSVRVVRPVTMPERGVAAKPVTSEYLPGLGADLYLPRAGGRVPLAVLVPGGAWVRADRSGLTPLAADLSAYGWAAATVTYRPAGGTIRYPVPVRDVACALNYVVQQVAATGRDPDPVVLIGHSAGGHLAALVALKGDQYQAGCPYAAAGIDALVGLAGAYDVLALPDVAEPLFGAPAASNPGLWDAGNPVSWADQRPELPALLVQGDSDRLVPAEMARQFAAALEQGGHPVDLEIVPGADHMAVIEPSIATPLILTWERTLSVPRAP